MPNCNCEICAPGKAVGTINCTTTDYDYVKKCDVEQTTIFKVCPRCFKEMGGTTKEVAGVAFYEDHVHASTTCRY